MFASAFGSPEWQEAIKRYFDHFEEQETPDPEEDYDVEEFVPQTETDVQEMLNATRRLGLIT